MRVFLHFEFQLMIASGFPPLSASMAPAGLCGVKCSISHLSEDLYRGSAVISTL